MNAKDKCAAAFTAASLTNSLHCANCRFHIRQDFGYSNVTVEGTNIECLFGHGNAFESSYAKEDDEIPEGADNARKCGCFLPGTGQGRDVEQDDAESEWRDWSKAYLNTNVPYDDEHQAEMKADPHRWMDIYLKD